MDIFFADPDEVPVPPDEMRIRSLEAAPYPDGRRVAVRFEISAFQQRPNIEVRIFNAHERIVADLSVVEAMENKMDFTMHLREPEPIGRYRLTMRLFYTNLDAYETNGESGLPVGRILDETGHTVASHETEFEIARANP